MALTIPNASDAAFPAQSEPDAVDIDILVAALNGQGVVSGCAVTAQGSPDMTVAVAAGVVQTGGSRFAVSAGNVTIAAADGTNPRFDLIVADGAGAKQRRGGTAAASPVFPTLTAGDVVVAAVYVPASDTAIAANQITDKRVVIRDDAPGPIAVAGSTTLTDRHATVVVNALAGAVTITLPTAVGIPGRRYTVKKIDVSLNAVTIDAAGSETIDDAPTFVLTEQYQSVALESDNVEWWVL